MPLDPNVFIKELDHANRLALSRIGARSCEGAPAEDLTVKKLLVLALKNELEATECAASWILTTPEVSAKLAFARQVGDESRHYRLIAERLFALGFDGTNHDPYAQGGRSPLLTYLLGLEDTVSRVAAGQFTREALAVVRNAEFIRFCESRGDSETAALYRDTIQPDETHHHELGRKLLKKLATTDDAQANARKASARVLELAEELQELAALKFGLSRIPGC